MLVLPFCNVEGKSYTIFYFNKIDFYQIINLKFFIYDIILHIKLFNSVNNKI